MRRLFVLSLLAGIALSGCVVRTRPGVAYRGGHGDRAAERHCHDRGGKHHKTVCHAHPHGRGHH